MSVSVIGQEAGIEHGTMKGVGQHKYRKVPATQECGCRQALSDYRAERKAASPRKPRPASSTSKAWNGGMTGATPVLPPRPLTGECSVPGCGVGTADTGRPGPDMVTVTVPGSREAPRWYCPGWCAVYGQALAEIRAIPELESG
ncbi:hypothetical protein [Streptomyces sp. NBC_01262]|uniref:hypothetical protein n=1 Tax=Streptomyces sp. NBC_01262 TaxID=2903803 RepID=UPI002E3642B6|nr:hypothetical protein [Streptomyces sp. NBC_01262]